MVLRGWSHGFHERVCLFCVTADKLTANSTLSFSLNKTKEFMLRRSSTDRHCCQRNTQKKKKKKKKSHITSLCGRLESPA